MAWFLQRISSVVLFILLIWHFVIYHFVSKGVFNYNDIVAKMGSPWFNLIQFIFLVTALYHGLNGIWMVSEDYIHNKNWRLFILGLILLIGISLFFIGILTIIKVASLG